MMDTFNWLGQKVHSGFSIRCYRKTWTKFLVNFNIIIFVYYVLIFLQFYSVCLNSFKMTKTTEESCRGKKIKPEPGVVTGPPQAGKSWVWHFGLVMGPSWGLQLVVLGRFPQKATFQSWPCPPWEVLELQHSIDIILKRKNLKLDSQGFLWSDTMGHAIFSPFADFVSQ